MLIKHRKMLIGTGVFFLLIIILFLGKEILTGDVSDKKTIKIGVTAYKQNDTFIAGIIGEMENIVRQQSQEDDLKINLNITYANQDQITQNRQVEKYISLGYDIICVNMVDRTSAAQIIDMAVEADIPIIFFNREPVADDMLRGENIYYVGIDAKESAVLQGEIVIGAYKNEIEKLDKNGNGILEYVMLEGESGHQDAMIRTEWSVSTIRDSGIEVQKLASSICNWERSQATAQMVQWLNTYGDQIELVICNNDDMALGAIDTIRDQNRTGIYVVGVDGTTQALETIKYGHMLGTVSCGTTSQAQSIYDLAISLTTKRIPSDKVEIVNDKYVRVKLYAITKENIGEDIY